MLNLKTIIRQSSFERLRLEKAIAENNSHTVSVICLICNTVLSLRTSALNMTLPAAAARTPAAVDRYLLPASNLRQISGQTDGRTPDRYIELHRIHAGSIGKSVSKSSNQIVEKSLKFVLHHYFNRSVLTLLLSF